MKIPEHLARFDWYAPHQAWLKSLGYLNAHEPGEARPTRAVLTGAVLTRAVLTGAVLTGADLTRAVLTGADLTGADLAGAVLTGADLAGAVLTGADLARAVLTGADLTGADLAGVPRVENLNGAILAAIEAGGRLDMGAWHTCETTHCRAGWAVTLAGDEGKALESRIGSAAAGALITLASCPYLSRVPDFYASDDAALADIKACAEIERNAP